MNLATFPERFRTKIDNSGGDCWIWTAAINGHGYPVYSIMKKSYYAHRLAWEWAKGPIPDNLTIDHLCRVKACVNPDHLEPVTRGENSYRAGGLDVANIKKRSIVVCKNGHDFTSENTYFNPRNGRRGCIACRLVNSARYRARKRG